MLARCAEPRRCSYRSRVTRGRKLSAGIQLAPLAKTGTPFTTSSKLFPHWSFSRRSSIVRSPTRVDDSSTTVPSRLRRVFTV